MIRLSGLHKPNNISSIQPPDGVVCFHLAGAIVNVSLEEVYATTIKELVCLKDELKCFFLTFHAWHVLHSKVPAVLKNTSRI